MSSVAYAGNALIPLAEFDIGYGQSHGDDMCMSRLQLAAAEPYVENVQMSMAISEASQRQVQTCEVPGCVMEACCSWMRRSSCSRRM